MHNTPQGVQPPWWKRFGTMFKRILVVLLAFFITASIAIVGLTQTQSFRQWLGKHILAIVNAQLEATIEFSDMGGNVLTGLTFDNIRIITRGDTLLYAKQLSVRYDIEPLLRNNITVNGIYLDSPIIKLLRSTADSSWNFAHIAKPSSDTTAAAPFTWTINVRNLTIVNGVFAMVDSTAPPQVPSTKERLNFSNIRVDNLNLSLTALANLQNKDYALAIHGLSGNDHYTSFALQDLSAKVNIDNEHTEVFDLHIQTRRSDAWINAQLENVNVSANADPVSWKQIPAQVSLFADSVSAADLHYFLPDLDFLDGTVALDLNAEGTYGNLNIKKLELVLANSTLSLAGQLKNLNTPEHLFIDARLQRTSLSYADVRTHLPGLPIPDLSYLGQVYIDDVTFRGEPTHFHSNFDIRTAVGALKGNGTLNVAITPMRYTLHAETTNANPAIPLAMPSLAGNINATIDLEGQGTSLDDLDSRLRLFMNNSTISQYSFQSLVLIASAKKHGLVQIDTLQASWFTPEQNRVQNSSAISELFSTGHINLQNTTTPVYDIYTQLHNANFDNFLPDQQTLPTLSGSIHIHGKGFHPDSLEGMLRANLPVVETPRRTFDSLSLLLTLERAPENYRSLQVTSGIADISLRGHYKFAALIDAIGHNTESIIHSVQQRYHTVMPPNNAITDTFSLQQQAETTVHTPLDAEFSIRLRDLSLLTIFSPTGSFHGNALLQGSIQTTEHSALLTLDSSRIGAFSYKDSNIAITTIPIALHGMIRTPFDASLSAMEANLSFVNDSMSIDNNVFTNTTIDAQYTNEQLTFLVSSNLDSTVHVYTRGRSSFETEHTHYAIELDSMSVGYRDTLRWNNKGTIRATIANGLLTIDSLVLQRNAAERIALRGAYKDGRFYNTQLLLESLPIQDINKFLPTGSNSLASLSVLNGRIAQLGTTISGTLEEPEIELYAHIDSLRYNGSSIGSPSISLTHSHGIIQGSVIVINPLLGQDSLTLTASVNTLPLNLAFTSVEHRLLPDKPIDITLTAQRLSLGIIAPFVPSISKLQGFANASFRIKGPTIDDVSYFGDATFSKTSFVINSTNVRYAANGSIELRENVVNIKEVNLFNDPLDLRNGRAVVEGDITLDGFDIEDIDLYITTPRLLVMNQSSKATSPTLYGDVIIATPDKPLHFYGSLNEPYLRGNVSILRADITFPEKRVVQRSLQRFCYKMLKRDNGELSVTYLDCPNEPLTSATNATLSTTATATSLSTNTLQKILDNTSAQRDAQNSVPHNAVQLTTQQPAGSLIDRLNIDVKVDIFGKFFITMELGTLQQLKAEVALANTNEPLRYEQLGTYQRLFGALTVKKGSTFQFYRTFDASGTLTFPVGEITNPQLDITAVYNKSRIKDKQSQDYKVQIGITGTKTEPKFVMTYEIDNVSASGDPAQIQSDAIMLIAFGRTQAELLAGGSGNLLGNAGQDAVTLGASALLTNILEGSGIIRSAEIDFADDQSSGNALDILRSRVRIVGDLSNVAQYRIESNVGTGSTKFTIEIPLGALFDNESMRNLALEITRTTNAASATSTQQKEWEIKFGWQLAF